MWKQVNQLINQLSPITQRTRKKVQDEQTDVSVELSVRHDSRAAAVVELQSLSRRSSQDRPSNGIREHQHSLDHPLAISAGLSQPKTTSKMATTLTDPLHGRADQKNLHSHGAMTAELQSFQAVIRRLLGQGWLQKAPSGVRLVLGACWELAASNLQQQTLRLKLQHVADSDSWQDACVDCAEDSTLVRALAEHYCPALTAGTWPPQLEQLPQTGCSLQAHFAAAVAAAATTSDASCSQDTSSDPDLCLHALEACVVLGEALQLQQEADCWSFLLQLAAGHAVGLQEQQQQLPTSHPDHLSATDDNSQQGDEAAPPALSAQQCQTQQQQDHHRHLQQPSFLVRPLLYAWTDAVLKAPAGACQEQQQPPLPPPAADNGGDGSKQMLPHQWDELLARLTQLQQQVQSALCESPLHPLHQPEAWAEPAARHADSGVTSSSAGLMAGLGAARLQELCGAAVPVLLQPSDVAGRLPLQQTDPDSLALVALLRLARCTSCLWLSQLAGSRSGSSTQGSPLAARGAAAASSAQQCLGPKDAPKARVRLRQLGSGTDAVADVVSIWQGSAAEDLSPHDDNMVPADSSSESHLKSPLSSWPDELLSTAQLWPGDVESEEDAAAITREERTLRSWMNSVLHRNAGSSSRHPGLLSHCVSVDSGIAASRGQPRASAAVSTPPRSRSMGGAGAHRLGVQAGGPLGGGGAAAAGVFRCSSAGAAAVAAAAHADSSDAVHSRSISADATGHPPELFLGGWSGEPAASSTPTGSSVSAAAVSASAPEAASTADPAAAAAIPSGAVAEHTASAAAPGSSEEVTDELLPDITSVSSLFGAELRSGVLLLEILDMLQPGCVDWRLANRPPFASRTAQLKALENCQLALKIAQEDLGLPLVSMSPRDVVLGRRKIILSLVYQLMRYNTMQLLQSISAVHHDQQTHQGTPSKGGSTSTGSKTAAGCTTSSAASTAAELTSRQQGGRQGGAAQQQQQQQVQPARLRALQHSGGALNIRSSSRKQRGQVAITEDDILAWANSKLQQVQPLSGKGPQAAAGLPMIRSFKDPVLSSGVVLLQLLHALAPELVDLSYVTAGHTAEQRQSNARYALSLADRLGCSLFLVWEDLVDPPQPRMVLVLLASLMYQDLQRQQPQLLPAAP